MKTEMNMSEVVLIIKVIIIMIIFITAITIVIKTYQLYRAVSHRQW